MRTAVHEEGPGERATEGRRASFRRSDQGDRVQPFAWLVDGMNVVGARPDGWWRDRAGAMRRLCTELERFAQSRGERVLVVFDGDATNPRAGRSGGGDRSGGPPGGLLEARFAPGGPDAADNVLVAMLAGLAGGRDQVTLVSSDRTLASAGRAAGVVTMGAASFLRALAAALDGEPVATGLRGRVGVSTPVEDSQALAPDRE